MMTEQFSQLASSSRKIGTFPSQPEVNPKNHASPSSFNPSELERKMNAVISLQSARDIDNQVRNLNEPYRYPHQFFQNSSPSSSPEIGSPSKLGDATDGVPDDLDSPSPPEPPSKEKNSSDSAKFSLSKGSSSSSFFFSKKVHMPIPHFSHRLKKKDQDHIEKMRETFSQVKINFFLCSMLFSRCLH